MSSRKRLIKNVSWNWIGMAVTAAVGFLILPLLVSRLGNDGYGLWILIGSLSGSFQLLDFGFRGSVGRFVAYHSTLQDREALSKVLSTATAILTGLGVIAFVGIAILTIFLPNLIEVPVGLLYSARLSLLLVGAHLGLWLISNIFDGALWGLQRFDLLNLIDGSLAIARLALVYFFVNDTNGLVVLGWITIVITVITFMIKAVWSARLMRGIKIRPKYVNRSTIRELTGYGIWNFVSSISYTTVKSLFPILVGSILGLAFVAPFAIARRLIEMVSQFLVAAAGVITPHTTTLLAQENHIQQRRMFIGASKYCAIVSLLAVVGMTVLSESFLTLWVGDAYSSLSGLVTILAIGSFVPMMGLIANSILLGMALHRCLAAFGIFNAVFSFVLAAILGQLFGLSGACLSLAVSGTIFLGICPILYTLRSLRLPCKDYIVKSILPAIAILLVPAAALVIAVSIQAPTTWMRFIVYGGAYTLVVAGITFSLRHERNVSSDHSETSAAEEFVVIATPIAAKELTKA